MMRRRGPGLVRVAATTAVVAGTANAVNRAMAPKPQQAPPPQQYAQEPEVVYVQAPQVEAPQAQALPSGGVTQDQINQLQQLAQLKDQGILTQQEFDAQKAKILGM